jgi:hypothetical protein
MTRLWKVEDGSLEEVVPSSLEKEAFVEEWVANDPSIIGLDLLIIARQHTTTFGGQLDLLGIDRNGDLTLIELKRDRTPRDVVAQTLDYGSWVNRLSTPEIHSIASDYLNRLLTEAFREKFDMNLPETLNASHNLLIVASSSDPSSRRIVEYLAEAHNVSINTAFFTYFTDGENNYLTADFLMDQEQVIGRAETKTKAPWTGKYYVNSGHDEGYREWEDMRQYGFVAAGYGRIYSGRLETLSEGDTIYVYQKGAGYIGLGLVTATAVLANDFITADGQHLRDLALQEDGVLHDPDDAEKADYAVRVDWKKTVPIAQGKRFVNCFSNQNVVCKLRDPATLEFLEREFG